MVKSHRMITLCIFALAPLLVFAGQLRRWVVQPRIHAQLAGRHARQPEGLSRQVVVLYFYPKDFTSGCTIEAHNFQRDLAQYSRRMP